MGQHGSTWVNLHRPHYGDSHGGQHSPANRTLVAMFPALLREDVFQHVKVADDVAAVPRIHRVQGPLCRGGVQGCDNLKDQNCERAAFKLENPVVFCR